MMKHANGDDEFDELIGNAEDYLHHHNPNQSLHIF